MLGGIIAKVVESLLSTLISRILAWVEKKRLEAAQKKAEALEAYLKSKESAGLEQDEYYDILKRYEENRREVMTHKQKLEALRQFNHQGDV